MSTHDRALGLDWFARTLGAPLETVRAEIGDLVAAADFRYRALEPDERDAVILEVLRRLEADDLTEVGAHRHGLWSEVWREQFDRFVAGDCRIEGLDPAFVGARRTVRLDGDYVEAASGRCELDYYAVVRQWLFRRWLGGCPAALEFGSGSAFNLVALARLYPKMEICGLDWAEAAVGLAGLLGERHGLRVSGRRFDFFQPDPGLTPPAGWAALTFCALEQIGAGFGPFLEFLLERRPAICVHMEPVLEFYDPDRLVDALALRYHTRRKYLSGFLPRLRALEATGRLEILDARRLRFGSLFHEGFSVIVWRPIGI